MTWYQTPDVSGSWGFWEVNRPAIPRAYWHYPDHRDERGWRDVASVYHPLIGPYDSGDPVLCEYHILLAKLAGIDAFVCDWYGPEPSREHPNDHTGFLALLRVAERLDFKVGLCWEDRSMFLHPAVTQRADAVARGAEVIRQIERDVFASPAYLRIDDRPVLMNFAWEEPDTLAFYPEEWDTILSAARVRPLFIHDYHLHHADAFFEGYESMAPWGSCLHGRTDVPEFWARAHASIGRGRCSFLSGTVRPGFDNRGSGGWGNGIALDPRGDGRRYREIWENVLKQPVSFIQIATWNDFNEGGTIEPARPGVAHPSCPEPGYGYRELETTQEFAGRVKGRVYDPGSLRVPALLYACRKMLDQTSPSCRDAADAIRDLLLRGEYAGAAEQAVRLYDSFPVALRNHPDFALVSAPASAANP